MLIVARQSKYEWELAKGTTHQELCQRFSSAPEKLEAILQSHESQVRVREELASLTSAEMRMLGEIHEPLAHDLVISLGGDNSFTYVSHYVTGVLMGVNADPGRSAGALCSWSSADLGAVVRAAQGEYRVEAWPRLIADVNGVALLPATSEYFLGERERLQMSRHLLRYRGTEYDQKGSGLLIATGAGSTGWYRSYGSTFPRTESRAGIALTEPFIAAGLSLGELLPGEAIEVVSLNDSEGIVSCDSWQSVPFPSGAVATVRIAETGLRVAVPR